MGQLVFRVVDYYAIRYRESEDVAEATWLSHYLLFNFGEEELKCDPEHT